MVRIHQMSASFIRQLKRGGKSVLKSTGILRKQERMKQTLVNMEIYTDEMMKYLITWPDTQNTTFPHLKRKHVEQVLQWAESNQHNPLIELGLLITNEIKYWWK